MKRHQEILAGDPSNDQSGEPRFRLAGREPAHLEFGRRKEKPIAEPFEVLHTGPSANPLRTPRNVSPALD